MTRNSILMVSASIAVLGVGLWWAVGQRGASSVAISTPLITSSQREASATRSKLEPPKPLDGVPSETLDVLAPAPDQRTNPAPAPVEFEPLYRHKSLPDLESRAEELSDSVRAAADNYAADLIAQGKFVRMEAKAADLMDRSKQYPDGRKRFTTKVCTGLPGSTEFGWLEFPLFDAPGAAELDRERSFVLARIDGLRETAKRKK